MVPANLTPLMTVRLEGAERQNLTITGAISLWTGGHPALGVLVALLSVAMPALWLLTLLPCLATLAGGGRRAWQGRLFRLAEQMRPWAMTEVYLLGALVAYSRMRDVATVDVGPGGCAFIMFTLLLLVGDAALDRRAVWRAIGPGMAPGSEAGAIVDCIDCGFIAPIGATGTPCPRCAAPLEHRRPDALRQTTALTVAALLLYVVANVLPVLVIIRFGLNEPATIFSGVRELIQSGLWPLAIIVFTASILVPLIKLFGLTWFLLAVRRGAVRRVRARTRLYRFVETIGRWSNIDIFMISILAALLQFGTVTRVEAQPGAVAFAAVVVLTMLASRAFDPRLMWDGWEAARG